VATVSSSGAAEGSHGPFRAEALKEIFPQKADEPTTDWRKRIQSCARESLPNSTEAPIAVTGNARAWRHVLSMRCSKYADVRIRRPMFRALQLLQTHDHNLFADFRAIELPDGTFGAEAEFPKP
jgi:thymidylate synthase (FAD)